MPKRKIDYIKGGIYHIVQRGNNKAFIFDDQLDKAQFLDIIKKVNEKYPFNMLYYVLMDNHYHFLIEMQDISISKIMQALNYGYSVHYNKKYNRTGTIFGSPYKAYYIKDTKYLIRVIQYIAENPVKAKMVKQASAYKWCAHSEIISKQTDIVAKKRIFFYLSDEQEKGLDIYMDLLNSSQYFDLGLVEAKAFNEILSQQIKKEKLEVIIQAFCDVNGFNEAVLFQDKRTNQRTTIRKRCAKHASELGYTVKEIAAYLKITPRSVRMMIVSFND
ncbi:transposase [Fusibacter bizertensis]|uniref:Transposase n=1 Tax=Fusibacter bizertensis TaxID=1488331 RepID=A0ABT6NFP8_9FIRM|nr:transposase [Fusibacter bizertensis]MDH8679260.1 transposase [Fusibacter bizertensis]